MNGTGDWGTFLEATLVAVMDSSEEGIVVFDQDGVCRMIGRRIGDFFGIDPTTLVGRSRAEIIKALSTACEEPQGLLDHVGAEELTAPARRIGDLELTTPRRRVTWSSYPLACESLPVGRLALVRDVTRERNAERAKRHLQARIEQLTYIDALTGLANRRRFSEEHEREHGRAMRAWDTYAVLRVDVDGMTLINEGHGTPVGDSILERVAEVIRSGRREYDVVARLENDEFAVLLPGADAIAVRAVAQRIHASLAQPDMEKPNGPAVSVSVGGAVCSPPTGETAADVMQRCGDAMDAARKRGRSETEVDASGPQDRA